MKNVWSSTHRPFENRAVTCHIRCLKA
jgi:hypothetical protein